MGLTETLQTMLAVNRAAKHYNITYYLVINDFVKNYVAYNKMTVLALLPEPYYDVIEKLRNCVSIITCNAVIEDNMGKAHHVLLEIDVNALSKNVRDLDKMTLSSRIIEVN